MFFCFTSSNILKWMEILLEPSIKTRCLQALQGIYWHSWHIFVTSWHLVTWRYPSDRPGSERKRVPLWLRMEHNRLEDGRIDLWFRLQNWIFFFPPNKLIYSLEPPKNWFGRCCLWWPFSLDIMGVDVSSSRRWRSCVCCRDPLSGEPTKSFRNIGKLRRDLTFVRVSQENMGRN